MKQQILIAGGSGLIGERLKDYLVANGCNVRILTRNKNKCDQATYFYWNPLRKEIDFAALDKVSVIINLCGAGIADKRWTKARKKELIDSRVYPALFLATLIDKLQDLKHYVSASGVNCYPLHPSNKEFTENDEFGTDFLSEVVQQWEMAANSFIPFCKVTKLRISTVLSEHGGALSKMEKPFQYYIGSPLGSGKQIMSWIHQKDLIRAFHHVIQEELDGTFNLTANQISNRDFSKELAKILNKPLLPIGVPSVILQIVLGEMAAILTTGVKIDNSKLIKSGFTYQFPTISIALEDLYTQKKL